MTPERFQRVEAIFKDACRYGGELRRMFLAEACGADAALRDEVEALLASDAITSSGLDRPLLGAPALPARIGRYRVLRLLGEGGMGAVYEAEQDSPRRRVALKVIRTPVASPGLLRRFESEIQILGQLQHPGIAQIYEAGVHRGDGAVGASLPFFAMELVQGDPLTSFVARRQFDTQQKLNLFAGVCDAVQFAHSHGVIHRDLKPANILVAEGVGTWQSEKVGTEPAHDLSHIPTFPPSHAPVQPKILDFGIARLTNADVQATTLQTNNGQILGTISYMSPEQVSGDSAAIDVRSDVYSLGVILYQLLTDRLPHDVRECPLPEAIRRIREDDITRLSSLNRTLRGDVETIALKALERDKQSRYASAGELATDIRRYLAGEPIAARPHTALYRARKFVQRHRTLVAATTTVILALAVGLAAAAWGLVRAEQERRDATAINRFLEDMLTASDPSNSRQAGLTVREMLDRATLRVDEHFRGTPRMEAEARSLIARTYEGLGEYALAEEQIRRAIALAEIHEGRDAPVTIRGLRTFAAVREQRSDFAGAESTKREALRRSEQALGPDHELTTGLLNDLADGLRKQGRLEEAAAIFERLVPAYRARYGENHRETLIIRNNHALVLQDSGRATEAAAIHEQIYAIGTKTLGSDHPDVLIWGNNLGLAYRYAGRLDESVRLGRDVVEVGQRVLGSTHARVQLWKTNLAYALLLRGELREAERLIIEARDERLRLFGARHVESLKSQRALAELRLAQGCAEDAAVEAACAIDLARGLLAQTHPIVGSLLSVLGRAHLALGQQADAEFELREAESALATTLGPNCPDLTPVREALAKLVEPTEYNGSSAARDHPD